MIDILALYAPTREELTPALLQESRSSLQSYMGDALPDVEFSENTSGGDLIINPAAVFMATMQIAMARFMSDLNLENVENNIIYNCDFVREYLGNFSVYDNSNLRAHGVVQLRLNSAAPVSVPRGTRFAFEEYNAYMNMELPYDEGDLTILPPGVEAPGKGNYVNMQRVDSATYTVDIMVSGQSDTDIPVDAEGASDYLWDSLVSITNITTIYTGAAVETLATLASKTRSLAYAASTASKGGISSLLNNMWSGTKCHTSIMDGEEEMQRNRATGPLLLPSPTVDVYLRTRYEMSQRTEKIFVPYDVTADKFIGELSLSSNPSVIESITTEDVTSGVMNVVVFSHESEDYPGVTSGYSTDEKLSVMIAAARDDTGASTVPLVYLAGDQSTAYGEFTVVYLSDPAFKPLAEKLVGDDYRPVGVDIKAKQGPLVTYSELLVRYRRKPGVIFRTEQARAEIAEAINNSCWPSTYGEHVVADSVSYAGGLSTRSTTYTGELRWTAAHRVLFRGVDLASVDMSSVRYDSIKDTYDSSMDAFLNSISYTAPTESSVSPDSINGVEVYDTLVDSSTGTRDMRVKSPRTLRMLIEPANIKFLAE